MFFAGLATFTVIVTLVALAAFFALYAWADGIQRVITAPARALPGTVMTASAAILAYFSGTSRSIAAVTSPAFGAPAATAYYTVTAAFGTAFTFGASRAIVASGTFCTAASGQ